jgi:hypothetical protein
MLKTLGTRSVVTLTLFIALSALAGCKGGGDASPTAPIASASTNPSPTAPTPTPAPEQDPAPSAPKTNHAPTISGKAPTSVAIGTTYTFAPQASDPDGDPLTFQIANKPAWATFNTVTGALSGTPGAAHAKTFANIVISVTDGKSSASLQPFSIEVAQPAPVQTYGTARLTWIAPTENTDGTQLTDLGGFVIVYGTSSDVLDQSVRIDNATVSSHTFDSLPSGTYYFAIKAFNKAGAESALSQKVSKQVS